MELQRHMRCSDDVCTIARCRTRCIAVIYHCWVVFLSRNNKPPLMHSIFLCSAVFSLNAWLRGWVSALNIFDVSAGNILVPRIIKTSPVRRYLHSILVLPGSRKKKDLSGFACSQSPHALFSLMQRVIGPRKQHIEVMQSVVW